LTGPQRTIGPSSSQHALRCAAPHLAIDGTKLHLTIKDLSHPLVLGNRLDAVRAPRGVEIQHPVKSVTVRVDLSHTLIKVRILARRVRASDQRQYLSSSSAGAAPHTGRAPASNSPDWGWLIKQAELRSFAHRQSRDKLLPFVEVTGRLPSTPTRFICQSKYDVPYVYVALPQRDI
jgi:hypothetical protein